MLKMGEMTQSKSQLELAHKAISESANINDWDSNFQSEGMMGGLLSININNGIKNHEFPQNNNKSERNIQGDSTVISKDYIIPDIGQQLRAILHSPII